MRMREIVGIVMAVLIIAAIVVAATLATRNQEASS